MRARGRWLAAVLACGADAVLSHRSAGALWGIVAAPRRTVHVTSAGQRGATDPLIALHRTRSLRVGERAVRDGIPVTSLARTLVDLAGVLNADSLRDTFEESDRLNLLELNAAAEACAQARGRRGVGHLRALVADAALPDYTRSRFERRFRHFCRAHALPAPEINVRVQGFEVDALWRGARVVVELDSWDFHGRTRQAFERDRARDAKLQLAGYRVYRLTWRRLESEPLVVARELRGYLAVDAAAGST